MNTRLNITPILARSQISAVSGIVHGTLKSDIDKYKKLSAKLTKSKSQTNTELCAALDAEAQALESTYHIYSAILAYLSNATSTVETQDASLIRDILR
jgi:hypothetical protein